MVIIKSTLIVREGAALDSEKLGQLRPGRRIYCLSAEITEGGDVCLAAVADGRGG